MHIAYLTPEYPHKKISNAGGMGTSIKNLVEALAAIGHQISVLVYGQKEDCVFEEGTITFHLIAQKTYKLGGFYFYRKHIQNYIMDHSEGIEIIEAPDWTGITAFMHFKIPLVIRFHGSDTYFCHIENRPQKWKNRFFEKQAMSKAVAFIAPTHYAGEVSMRLLDLPMHKLKVIHYGLQLENFQNNHPEDFTAYSLLNIGTLIRKKGVFQLIEIFNKLVELEPTSTLVFIGADSGDVQTGASSTWELMKSKMTANAEARIFYLGKVPYHEVQSEIKKAHVCVFPSLAETLGMVTIEAMALKKAVVNTNIGWAQDLIEHGVDGFMHHPDDINSYISTISILFKDQLKVEQIGQAARVKIEARFDINKIAHQNLELYKSISSQ
ncbi:MAG: glycosyltransferase involved in cell wall biosynthesis [Nonlabens sp.]|jgi:glycosyltransferase involved in cell wall biosynthesis|uniref:glycosyltransferase family 4 protein n=1 Tax=Nonlabens sp. TaxID=1888209 RepID=UPI0039E6F4AA